MIARMSEALALEYRFRTARSGFFRRMFWIVGMRKPSVLPVPVRACATLVEVRRVEHHLRRYVLTYQCLANLG